jgi:hypothetical protein
MLKTNGCSLWLFSLFFKVTWNTKDPIQLLVEYKIISKRDIKNICSGVVNSATAAHEIKTAAQAKSAFNKL